MNLRILSGVALIGILAACAQPDQSPKTNAAPEQTTKSTETDKKDVPETSGPDYASADFWLCHPSKVGTDECATDLSTTIVKAGSEQPLTELEPFEAAEEPGIDCFYVYPTVSTDASGNSDLIPDAAEKRVVKVQFARFASVCRLYAPVYRQVSLAGLRARMTGKTDAFNEPMAYEDVKAAWNHYLEHENNGRGVILVGHSQGARMIQFLLENDIIGKPVEKQVISAMPIGYTYLVDRETQTFKGMPLCGKKDQTGCIVSYVTFRNDSPPPPTSWFGLSMEPGKQAACVNPAALTGGDELKPYLSNVPDPSGREPNFAGDAAKIETPYASLPGLLTAKCVEKGVHTYLEVTTHGDPDDPRTDWVAGDVYVGTQILKDWGLHLGDMHLAMGNLLEIAQAQGDAWEAEAQ